MATPKDRRRLFYKPLRIRRVKIIYIITVQIIFSGSSGVIEFQKIYFKNRVLATPMLVGVAGLAHLITGHDMI